MKKIIIILLLLINFSSIAQTNLTVKNLTITKNASIRTGDMFFKRFIGNNNNNLFGSHTGDSLISTSIGNNFFGSGAGAKVKIGNHNNLFGTATCFILIEGDYNNAIGFNSLASLKIGNSNTAIGKFSGALLDTSYNNLLLGDYSGMHLTKISNRIIIDGLNRGTAHGDTARAPFHTYLADSTTNQRNYIGGQLYTTDNVYVTKDLTYGFSNYSGRATGITYTPNTVLNTPFRLALVLTQIKSKNVTYVGDTAVFIGLAGNYVVELNTFLTATAAGESYKIAVYKNNALVTTASSIITSTGASYYFNIRGIWDLQGLSFNDIITFKITNLTNGNDPTFKEAFLYVYKKPE